MVKIADSAKVTLGGKKLLDDTASAAQLVWESFHEKARNHPQKYAVESYELEDGRVGISIQASLSGIIKNLWPELSYQDDETKNKLRLALARISIYLRAYGNMVLLHKGYSNNLTGSYLASTWWVSNEYNDSRQASKVRVSSKEMGENRVPSEISTRWKCRFCENDFTRKDSRDRHEYKVHGLVRTDVIPQYVPAPKQQHVEVVENGDVTANGPAPSQAQSASDPVAALQFLLDDYKAMKMRLEAIERVLKGDG